MWQFSVWLHCWRSSVNMHLHSWFAGEKLVSSFLVTLLLVHQFELWQAFNADITQYDDDDDSDDTIFLLLRHVSVHRRAQSHLINREGGAPRWTFALTEGEPCARLCLCDYVFRYTLTRGWHKWHLPDELEAELCRIDERPLSCVSAHLRAEKLEKRVHKCACNCVCLLRVKIRYFYLPVVTVGVLSAVVFFKPLLCGRAYFGFDGPSARSLLNR